MSTQPDAGDAADPKSGSITETGLKADPIAKSVSARLRQLGEEANGVVVFTGLLDDVIAAEPGVRRLYVDDTFRTWLAIAEDDICGHISSTSSDDARGMIWVRRDAPIKHVRSDSAHAFYEGIQDAAADPTGGDYGTRGSWPRARP